MPLQLNKTIPHRTGIDRGLHQPHRDLGLPPSPVEPVDEFVNVFLQILMRHTMKRTQKKSFKVADHDMHLRQPFSGLVRGCHLRVMLMGLGYRPQRSKRIGSHLGAFADAGAEFPDRPVIDMVDRACDHESGAGVVFLNREYHRLSPLGAPSPLARALAAHKGVVKLDQSVQQILPVAVGHGCAQLAEHQPGGPPVHTDHLRQPQRRHAALVGAHQIDGGEPLGQAHLAVVEHGAGGHRGLAPAVLAFAKRTVGDLPGLVMSALRADEAVSPSDLLQKGSAGVFGGVFLRPFEIAGLFLFHFSISSIKSISYRGNYTKYGHAILN